MKAIWLLADFDYYTCTCCWAVLVAPESAHEPVDACEALYSKPFSAHDPSIDPSALDLMINLLKRQSKISKPKSSSRIQILSWLSALSISIPT